MCASVVFSVSAYLFIAYTSSFVYYSLYVWEAGQFAMDVCSASLAADVKRVHAFKMHSGNLCSIVRLYTTVLLS